MFLQRLITSLILVPLVLLIIFYAHPWILAAILVLITLGAGRECWQLIPIKDNRFDLKIGYLIVLLVAIWACGLLFPYWQTLGALTWLGICAAIISFPKSQKYWGHPIAVACLCLIVISLFVQSLIHLYYLPQGKSLLVYLLFLIWAADVGAYLAGKQWGKHKLIPQVSPGKSWEGLMGGFALAMVVATVGYFYYVPNTTYRWFGVALITVIISIFGDLFISILKRRCHLKDTGDIIPGHGGILDRLDSLIAALPVFYYGLTFMPLGI